MTTNRTVSRWSLSYQGNRVMWAVVGAFVTWLAIGGLLAPLVVGAVVYLLLTLAVRRR